MKEDNIKKQWIRNEFIGKRLVAIVQQGKPTADDAEFVHSLCTDGSVDPCKRSFRVHCKKDGLFASSESPGEGQGRIHACIYTPQANAKIVQVFHLCTPVPMDAARVTTARAFLDLHVPNWVSMKSLKDGKINDFLLKKTEGEEGYFVCSAAQSRVEPRDTRPFHLASAIAKGQVGEVFNEDCSSVTARKCYINEHPGFSLTLHQKESKHQILASCGLYSVVLDQKSRDGGYIHGLRSLAKSISRRLFSPDPRPLHIEHTFRDAVAGARRISSFGLVTNRPIAEATDFAGMCRELGIRYSREAPPARRLLSAYGTCQSLHALKAFDVQNFQIRGITKLGYSDEEVCDMLLSAFAAACHHQEGTVNILNRIGVTGGVKAPRVSTKSWPHEFVFEHQGKAISVHVVRSNVVAGLLASGTDPGESQHCIAFAEDSGLLSLYLHKDVALDVVPDIEPESSRGAALLEQGPKLQDAVARLCYIVAFCRSIPRYARFERSLRAIWLNTELVRFKGNAHDCCILSMVAKNCSGSMHYSVLPYV